MFSLRIVGLCTCLLFALPSFCDDGDPNLHEPSIEEAKTLRVAATSPLFNFPGESLRQVLFNSSEGELDRIGIGDSAGFPYARDPVDLIRPTVCGSDLVVLGKIMGKTSTLSANETVVITLDNFQIQIVYNGRGKDLAGRTISVLRRGGMVVTPQGTIREQDLSIPPLKIGSDYILFLKQLAGSEGFVSTFPEMSMVLPAGVEGKATSLKGNALGDVTFNLVSEFLELVRKVQCPAS